MTLYVVPTPIGNLEDITLRAIRTLREVSLILAEDTRHTRRLLTHFEIDTPLLSYHQHNKVARLDRALQALHAADVALVSDSGMPSISDPGFELIAAAVQDGVAIDVLPGPSAVITAVTGAAIPAPGFLFAGFLPRRSGERKKRLRGLATLQYALVFYEAPHRLSAALQDIRLELGDRPMVAARELTKVHQEYVRGTVSEVERHFAVTDPRGELTLVVSGAPEERRDVGRDALESLRLRAESGEDRRTAIAAVVRETGISRNEAYRMWVEVTESTR